MSTEQRVLWYFRKYKLDTAQIAKFMKLPEHKVYDHLMARTYSWEKEAA